MLLASPLKPGAIVLGKLLASLAHLALLIFSSLPIVLLCLPLGGTSLYEVLTVYFALILLTVTFGMISLACSSYFRRTAASLVVSYLVILPLALSWLWFWAMFERMGAFRLVVALTVLPAACMMVWFVLGKPPASGCCIRPTWAAKERKSSTSRPSCKTRWAW